MPSLIYLKREYCQTKLRRSPPLNLFSNINISLTYFSCKGPTLNHRTNILSVVYIAAENVTSMLQKSVPLIFEHYVPYKYEWNEAQG